MAKEKAQTVHREWFDYVPSCATCPTCGKSAKRHGVTIMSWGEYIRGKYRVVRHFCSSCVSMTVAESLARHAEPCGCTFELRMRGWGRVPDFVRDAVETLVPNLKED